MPVLLYSYMHLKISILETTDYNFDTLGKEHTVEVFEIGFVTLLNVLAFVDSCMRYRLKFVTPT